MLLQDLPYELLLQIMSNLDKQDIIVLVQCNASLYNHSRHDSFWQDLCRLHNIFYCHPDLNWKELYSLQAMSEMCPHLNRALLDDTSAKRELLWSNDASMHATLCMYPSCQTFDCKQHPLQLKLSPLHALELWCSSCSKTIGFNGFATHMKHSLRAECYFMENVIRDLTVCDASDNPAFKTQLQTKRQQLEHTLYQYQYRQSTMHIINKEWYESWLAFISGKSTLCPGPLTNQKLFVDGKDSASFNPALSLGKDFEVVGSLVRWYIERVYGVQGKIISANDLPNNADYCKIIHKIRLRQQINQATRYPFNQ